MKIRMQEAIAGSGFVLRPGDVTDRFSDFEAIRLVERGYAVPVAEVTVETATLSAPPERRGKRKRDVVPAHGH